MKKALINKKRLPPKLREAYRYRWEYLIILPILIFFFIFHYKPMYGLLMAFKKFRIVDGVMGSPWLDPWYEMFERIFTSDVFLRSLRNTLLISILKTVVLFPIPIIFAILLDELPHKRLGKVTQTVSYLPYFISWVVIGGILRGLLSPSYGPINFVIKAITGETIYFLGEDSMFRSVVVISYLWQSMGYSAVVYIAAITGVNQDLYDAARLDGASRWQLIRHITLPCIAPTIVTMFILGMGNILGGGFDQIFNLYSPATYESGDIIGTYVYRVGIEKMQYSYSTAVGLFQNVVGFIMVVITNKFASWIDKDSALY